MADETVTTQLILDAKAAIQAFREFNSAATSAGGSVKSLQQKVSDFERVVASEAQKANVTFERQLALFKELNTVAMAQKKGGVFGKTGGADPFAMVQQLHNTNAQKQATFLQGLAQRQAASEPLVAQNKALLAQAGAIGKVTEEHNKLGTAATTAGEKSKAASAGMVGGINLVRLALHVLVTSAIFAVIAGFTKLFSMAVDGLKKIEVSVYNLANAERALSQSGVEVSFKELEAVVDRLYGKFDGLFSRLDIQDAVADISIATKELGLTSLQIEKIAASAAAIQLRNPEKSISEVSGQLLTAILSGQTKGIRSMGVAASEAAIQQKALELGLIKVGEEADAQQKSIATLELVYEATAGDAENLTQYQNTLTGAQQELAATWKDLLAELAKDFAPMAIQGLKVLIYDLQVLQKIFQFISPHIQNAAISMASFVAATKGLGGLNIVEKFQKFTSQFKEAKEAYADYFDSFSDSIDTPTAEPEPVVIDTSQAEEELEDLLKDLEKIQDKIDETESDHKLKISRFDEDAGTDRSRAVSDYNLNVLQATRAFNLKKKDDNKKYRQKEMEEERKFNEEMRKMQEDFLFSLEDALRERDARQILRLIEKHRMDKESATNAESIRKKTASENQSSEQADNKKQLEEKLRVMAEDQAVKMQRMDADSALKRKRMEEDHALEMAELKEQLAERIQEAATKMAEELGVNAEGAKAIHDLLKSYYGTDGAMRLLAQEGYAARLQDAATFMSSLAAIAGQAQALSMGVMGGRQPTSFFSGANSGAYAIPANSASSKGGTSKKNALPRVQGFAEGGQFIATRPTPIIVGEGGQKELVSITPLSEMQGSSNMSRGGIESMGGTINLEVTLSPDLKVEIIESTLKQTANIVTKIRRSK